MNRILNLMVLLAFCSTNISLNGQVYLGTGITRSFAHKFNGDDLAFSIVNPDNQPVASTWLANKSYNFFTLFTGYRLKREKYYHDIRITATNKGAISLHDKPDYTVDPIFLDLNAFQIGTPTPSTIFEIGVNNRVVGLRYGFGKRWLPWCSAGMYIQSDLVYKKIITINWYSDQNLNFYTARDKRRYFLGESEIENKISTINVELGINALIHLGKYFAINLEIGQSIIPSVHKGPHPEYSEYVYFEKNEYFTSMQLGLLTYFGK